jgi:phospholipid/cholesterol/gamma-HCH transport system permease protein
MPPSLQLNPARSTLGQALLRSAASWRFMLHFGAVVLVMALSPSTYNRAQRASTAQYMYISTWQVLPGFTALSALLSLVLIRIVVVTALSYGLSQYALQMVVRVLVLELIPLSAAMFVALRAGLSYNTKAAEWRSDNSQSVNPHQIGHLANLRSELTPRVFANAFSVMALAAISCAIALLLTYLSLYGLSPWGLPNFTRTVGQVFDLDISLGFMLKTVLFSLAVAVVPMAASLEFAPQNANDTIQPGAVRLFLVLLLIEAASLAVKYI